MHDFFDFCQLFFDLEQLVGFVGLLPVFHELLDLREHNLRVRFYCVELGGGEDVAELHDELVEHYERGFFGVVVVTDCSRNDTV